ncbi:MAG: type II secretion system protein GspM [Myxococcota bacterium]
MAMRERAEALLKPLHGYQVRFADFLDERTARERQMLAAMAIAFVLWLLYWAVVGMLLRPLDDSRELVRTREKALQEMLILRADYQRIQSQVSSLENMIRRGQHGNVLSRLETMANQASIKDKISSMDPKSAPPNDLYKENVIEVRLANVNLKQLVDYLFRIESSSHLLKIKRLRIKVRSDDARYLDVNFRVSSFEPLAGGTRPVRAAASR